MSCGAEGRAVATHEGARTACREVPRRDEACEVQRGVGG